MIIALGHLHGTVTDSRELVSIRTLCTMLATCLEQILRQSVALCWSRLQSNGSFKLLMIDFALYRLCAIQAELLYLISYFQFGFRFLIFLLSIFMAPSFITSLCIKEIYFCQQVRQRPFIHRKRLWPNHW